MGLFGGLGELLGEIVVAPFTIVDGIVKGVNKGIDEITEE